MNLGEALLQIDIKVTGLKSSSKKINTFFNDLEVTIDLVNSSIDRFVSKVANIGRGGGKGIGKLVRGFEKISSELRESKGRVDKLEKAIEAASKQTKSLDKALDPYNSGLKKSKDSLKDVCKLLDKVKKKSPKKGGIVTPSSPSVKDPLKGLATKSRDISSSLRQVGQQATFAGIAIAAAFAPILIEGAKFEQGVANVASVISGLTDGSDVAKQKIEELSQSFRNLGKTTEFTSVQVADAARQLALSGFSDEEIKQSIESIVDLASATNTELDKTALIAARITRAFGLTASSFGDVSDTLAVIAANSNTTLEGLGESFKLAAPIAAAYGQSVEEIAVAFGVLGDAGIQNSRAGTGISRFLSELTEKQEDVTSFLESIGSSFDKIDPSKVEFSTEAIKEFQRLSNLGLLDPSDIFREFDQRSARTVQSLTSSGSGPIDDLIDKLNEAAGAAKEIRDFRVDTVEGSFKILKSAVSDAAVALTTKLAPAIRGILKFFKEAASAVSNFVEKYPGLVKFGAGLAVLTSFVLVLSGALLTLSGIIAGVVSAFAFVAPLLSSIGVGFAAFSAAGVGVFAPILAAALPLIAAIAAITAGVYLLAKAFTAIYGRTRKPLDGASESAIAFNQQLKKMNDAAKTVENSLRDVRKRLELISDIGTLKPVQIDRLIDLSGAEGVLGAGEDAKDAAEEAYDNYINASSFVRKLQDDEAFNSSFFQVIFRPISAFAEDRNIKERLEAARKGRDEFLKLFDEASEAATTTNKQIDSLTGGSFISQEFAIRKKLLEQQAIVRKADSDLARERLKSDEKKRLDIIKKNGELTIKTYTAQLKKIAKLEETVSEDRRKLLESRAQGLRNQRGGVDVSEDGGISEKEFQNQLKKLGELTEANSRLNAARTSERGEIDEFFDNAALKGDVRDLVAELESKKTAVLALLDRERQRFDLKIKNNETRIKASLERIAGLDSIGDSTKEADKEKNDADEAIKDAQEANKLLNESRDALDQKSKDATLLTESKILGLKKENREAQQKILQDAELARAQAQGDLATEIRIFQERKQATIDLAVETFKATAQYDENNNLITDANILRQLAVELQEDLNEASDIELRKKLEVKEVIQGIIDLERELNDELLSKEELEIEQAKRKEEERNKKLDEDIKAAEAKQKELQEVIGGDLASPETKATAKLELAKLKKELDKKNDLRKKIAASASKAEAAAIAKQDKKEAKALDDALLARAIREEDVNTEFDIKRKQAQEALEKELDELRDGTANNDKVRKLKEAELDAKLAEDKIKRIEQINKEQSKGTEKTKTASTSKAGNNKRAEIEDSIASSLANQVTSLREARELLGFIATLEAARQKAARREGKGLISAQRRVTRIESEISAQSLAGNDTSKLNNELARAKLELILRKGSADAAISQVGASAEDFAKVLEQLNSRLRTNLPSSPTTKNNQNLPNNQAPVGTNKTVNVDLDVNIDGFGFNSEELAQTIKESVYDLFSENPIV